MKSVKSIFILMTLVVVLLPNLSSGQVQPTNYARLSTKVKECVASIERETYFAFTSVNGFGREYPVFLTFLALDSLAKEKELLFLAQHVSPKVRCYAFWSLLRRNHPDWLSILIHHLADPEKLAIASGDVARPDELIGDIMLSIVKQETDGDDKQVAVSTAQQQAIDSILIFSAPKLDHRNQLFLKLKPSERNYARIQHLVVSEKDNFALIALARFRKPVDRIYIEQTLKLHITKMLDPTDDQRGACAFQAVIEYPDASFFDELVSIHRGSKLNLKRGWYSQMLYRALVRYETLEVDALLRQAIQDTTNTRKGVAYNQQTPFIYVALEEYTSAYWNELRAKIPMSEEDKQSYLSLLPLKGQ